MTRILQENISAEKHYFAKRYEGYKLASFESDDNGLVTITLAPATEFARCPKCGQWCNRFHEVRSLTVTDWDALAVGAVRVIMPLRRVRCRCGCSRTEAHPSWLLPNHRITKTFAAFIQKLLKCRISNKDIEKLTGVNWNLIKELDKAMLEVTVKEAPLEDTQQIALDEIAIHKGHKYATVAMDLGNKRILWVGKGKKMEDVQPFFDKLKDGGYDENIQSVSVDMNAGFPALVKKNLPYAKLAYDLFHVFQGFTRDVLVEAKRETIAKAKREWKNLSKEEQYSSGRQVLQAQMQTVKGAEWLVVTQPELLKADRLQRLEELQEQNALFRDLYPLAAKLRQIWKANSAEEALEMLNDTIEICLAIGETHSFKPITRFAKMLKRRSEGIVNACLVGVGTNMLEGANNVAKVIKRVAFGYRDFEYFSLKLKAAFPGKEKQFGNKKWRPTLYWNKVGLPLTFPQFL